MMENLDGVLLLGGGGVNCLSLSHHDILLCSRNIVIFMRFLFFSNELFDVRFVMLSRLTWRKIILAKNSERHKKQKKKKISHSND
jgi:hypothetical protein